MHVANLRRFYGEVRATGFADVISHAYRNLVTTIEQLGAGLAFVQRFVTICLPSGIL